MRCAKSELIVLLGVGMFLAGSISLIAITMQKIFPAREEQTFKEINCTIVSGDMNATTKCSNKNQEGSYPCLRIYVLCGKDKIKENPSLESTQPRLLRKDFYSLQKQCTLPPEQCSDKKTDKHPLKKLFHSGNPVGSNLHCFYNPSDPEQIVSQKASKESYNKMVLSNVVWPLAVILLAVIITAGAACFLATRPQAGYEKLEGVTSASLYQTLWKNKC